MAKMRYTHRFILLNLVLLIMLVVGSGTAADRASNLPTSVLLNKEALIVKCEVLLGDIASIVSPDEVLADRLRKIHICTVAEPGSARTLHAGYVKSRMRRQGIPPESINWSGSEQTVVKTKSQILSSQEILSYAEKFVVEQVGSGEEEIKGEEQSGESHSLQTPGIQVLPVNEIRPVVLPYGEIAVEVEAIPSASRSGITPLRIIVSVDGRVCEKRVIFFRVIILKEVLVAAHTLNRHEIVAEDDLRLVLRDVGGSLADSLIFSRQAELIGKRAKRTIREGTAIVADMVEDTPIVNRGDLVTIIIESPAFIITTQGKAREAGARSQIIRVMNTSSMKEIAVEVIDVKLVRVAFADHR